MTPIAAMKQQKFRRPILLTTLIVGIAVFVGCLTLTMGRPPAARSTGPMLVLPHNVRDLGRRTTRQEWRVPFQFQNSGTRRLVINEVDTGCGCGDPIRKTVIIPPGESAEVTVTLDARLATGPVEKITSFTTSDPAQPRVDLTVRAWVDGEKPVATGLDDRKQASVLVRQ